MLKPFFSLRYKLILAFLFIGFFISIALGYTSFRVLEKRMFKEFMQNVSTVTKLSTKIVDRSDLEKLVTPLENKPTSALIDKLKKSKELLHISRQLEFIRNSSTLVTYVYLIIPTSNPAIAKQIADADFLHDHLYAPDFYTDLDVSMFPDMQKALKEKVMILEKEFTYDELYDTYSISGYAPIMANDNKTFLALLGIDMANRDARKALMEVTRRSIIVGASALFISILIAVIIGIIMTRNIIRLDRLMRQFADNDFTVRARLSSNDEVGRLGYSFNQMADTIQQFIQASDRFVPHDLLKLLRKDNIIDVQLGDHVLREMVILFADVRNFTSISENMSVKDNFNFINSYLKKIGPIVRKNKGLIDKYLGDGIMALFPGQADDALNAAVSIQRALKKYNRSKDRARYHEVSLGIGVHLGDVMLGTVGEKQRMDGTVISDAVNLSSRLESLNKRYGTRIIISNKIVEQLSQQEAYFIRYIDKVRVVGKAAPISIYEICDADDEEIRDLKKSTLSTYNQGVELYYSRYFKKAETCFKRVIEINPDDQPAQLFYKKSRYYSKHMPPESWDGVTTYDQK